MAYGAALKEAMTTPGPWRMGITGFGECLPYAENRVTINKDKKDIHGLPTLNVDAEWKENERLLIQNRFLIRGNQHKKAPVF